MALLTADETEIPAWDGKKLLTGGQYLRVPAGSTIRVDFDLEVDGTDAEVELHQDVFLNGHERFARKNKRIHGGERWRLSYEIDVPGSLKSCIRILVNWNTPKSQGEIVHVYIKEAKSLRPDLSQLPPVDFDELEKWIAEYMAGHDVSTWPDEAAK